MRKLAYLIIYDICSPKRLARVHRLLCRHATPIQYSVFLTEASEREISELHDAILDRIHLRQDDVRIYPLSRTLKLDTIGQPTWPHQCGMFLDSIASTDREVSEHQ